MFVILAVALLQPVTPPSLQARDSLWYRAVHARDVTGDGIPDTLILEATGRRVDSLEVTLNIRSQGRRLYHERWLSTYYFAYDAPTDSIPESTRRTQVFRHLSEFFSPERFSPLTTAGGSWKPRDDQDPRSAIAFDIKYRRARDSLTRAHTQPDSVGSIASRHAWSAPFDTSYVLRIWQELATTRRVTFTFFSGGEYTRTIVWSPILGRFVVVFSCC